MATLVTATWVPSHRNLTIEAPRSYHRQGPFLRTACHCCGFQSPQQMWSTRLTFPQKVRLEERPTPQGLPQRNQLRCSCLATLNGPSPTEPAGTLPKQSTPHYHRTAQKILLWPLEWRWEFRASQRKPSNRPQWPTRRSTASQRTTLAEHCLRNRAGTDSNYQACALRPKPL